MPVTEHFYGDDFIWCFLDPLTTRPEFDAEGRKVDEWGNVWATMGETFGEPIQYAYAGLENTQTVPAGLAESRLV